MPRTLIAALVGIALLAAGCRSTYTSTYTPTYTPTPDVRQSWDFAAGQIALGWQPTNDLASFDFDAQGLRTSSTGGDPYLVGPSMAVEAASALHVEVRMRSTQGRDAQLFWESDGVAFNEPASQHFEVNPDGEWHTYRVTFKSNPNWKGTITRLRLDPTAQPGAEIGIAFIRVIGMLPASIVVERFAPTAALAIENRAAGVQAVLRNAGDSPSAGIQLRLNVPPASGLKADLTADIAALAPGEIHTVTWSLEGMPAGVFAIGLQMDSQWMRETSLVVEAARGDPARTLLVGNDRVRLSFARQPFGYGIGTLEWNDGQAWRAVGRLQSLGEVVSADAQGLAQSTLLYAPEARASATDLEFTSAFTGSDGVAWRSRVTFAVAPSSTGLISITQSLTADREARLLAWRGPKYLPGEGTFGGARDSALFPGLEYLLADDQSSSDRYAAAPLNRRYVPHPNKITIPLMAVTHEGVMSGLMWNPLQRWDGQHDRPAALFASPNTWDGQPNHLMQLFAPGFTAGLRENADRLDQPYALAAGAELRLEAALFAAAAPDPTAPVQFWLNANGLPAVPSAPPELDVLQRSVDNYQNGVWVPASKGWRYALNDPWGPGYNPGVALHLWLSTLAPDLKASVPLAWRATTRSTLSSPPVGGQPNPWAYQPAYLLNQVGPDAIGLAETLARLQTWQHNAWSATGGQREDGAWGYAQANAAAPRFGAQGDTSNGYTATRAYQILYVARITGDPQLAESGLKALRFLEQQPLRPEGAQTWELSLHVPDLLASAWVAQSFVEGYRLTGDAHYLDQAQRWAMAGLPFVYLWNAPDRDVMRYATVPVFGATNYTYPWFGRPVMWNGLDYALGLQSLAAELETAGVAPALDWRRVAQGITAATAQMQSHDPAYNGMYPDAWDVVSGGEAYTWWLAPTYLMQNMLLLRDQIGAQVNTRAVDLDGRRVRVNAVADIQSIDTRPGDLRVSLRYYPGEMCALAVTQLGKAPSSVSVGGAPLDAQDWSYSQGWLIARVPFKDGDAVEVAVKW